MITVLQHAHVEKFVWKKASHKIEMRLLVCHLAQDCGGLQQIRVIASPGSSRRNRASAGADAMSNPQATIHKPTSRGTQQAPR